jgi:hypothetical protein
VPHGGGRVIRCLQVGLVIWYIQADCFIIHHTYNLSCYTMPDAFLAALLLDTF